MTDANASADLIFEDQFSDAARSRLDELARKLNLLEQHEALYVVTRLNVTDRERLGSLFVIPTEKPSWWGKVDGKWPLR
jgi:hypothetical protein